KIVQALTEAGPMVTGSEPIRWMQSSVWFYAVCALVASVIIGAARMAWEQRADPGKEVVRALFTFIGVTSFGLLAIILCFNMADNFSRWILNESSSEKFGERLMNLLGASAASGPQGAALGVMTMIFLGTFTSFIGTIQIVLLII